MTEYPFSELPPNHRALVQLVKSLGVDTVTIVDSLVILTYSDGKKPLTIRMDEDVPRNNSESDRAH